MTHKNPSRALIAVFLFIFCNFFGFKTAFAEPALEIGYCAPGQERLGAVCMEACGPGMERGVFGQCRSQCAAGQQGQALTCAEPQNYRKATYLRPVGVALQCPVGSENVLGLCYAPQPGASCVGPVCRGVCPGGTDWSVGSLCVREPRGEWRKAWFVSYWVVTDFGWTKPKPTWMRTASLPNTCPSGMVRDGLGLLCHQAPRPNYTCLGTLCSASCAAGETDLGLACVRNLFYPRRIVPSLPKGLAQVCPDYERDTRYPLVLVHGMMGFDKLSVGSVNIMTYFNHIAQALSKGPHGSRVLVATVPPADSSERRGEVLVAKLREWSRQYGYTKFHLIGHSHGGATARYAAYVVPELVASITTVGAPHRGTPVADAALQIRNIPVAERLTVQALDSFARLLSTLNGGPIYDQDALAQGISLSTAGSLAFNQQYPAGLETNNQPLGTLVKDGREYPMLFYSWTGSAPFSNWINSATPALFAMDQLIFKPKGLASDGVVGVESAKFGKFLGAYEMDHMAEVNMLPLQQALTAPLPGDPTWRDLALLANPLFQKAHPVTLFCEHANRLKKAEQILLQLGAQ